jgi:polysaccharide export outer membrane protein
MPRANSLHGCPRIPANPVTLFRFLLPMLLALLAGAATDVCAQTGAADGGYMLGQDNKRLQIVVYVLGEVDSPGEYIVPDDTDVLELISKAGGPTEFANMGDVSLKRRGNPSTAGFAGNGGGIERGAVEKVNLDRFLSHETSAGPPLLRPGDVVVVPRNRWHSWRTAFTVVRDISVVVSTYLLYRRVVN